VCRNLCRRRSSSGVPLFRSPHTLYIRVRIIISPCPRRRRRRRRPTHPSRTRYLHLRSVRVREAGSCKIRACVCACVGVKVRARGGRGHVREPWNSAYGRKGASCRSWICGGPVLCRGSLPVFTCITNSVRYIYIYIERGVRKRRAVHLTAFSRLLRIMRIIFRTLILHCCQITRFAKCPYSRTVRFPCGFTIRLLPCT
jgi:hypothetical protein